MTVEPACYENDRLVSRSYLDCPPMTKDFSQSNTGELHLYECLSDAQKNRLFAGLKEHRYKRGETIIGYGDVSEYLFFILKGRMVGTMVSATGYELVLRILGPGNFFAYGFCFRRTPSLFNYAAQSDLIVQKIHLDHFEDVVKSDQGLALNLLKVLVDRLESAYCFTAEQLTEVSFVRVAHIVGRLATRLGEIENGEWRLRGLSHQDIANFSGLSRPRVTESLNELQRLGLLQTSREEIRVTNPEALVQMKDI